ncbi:hypothetical protein ALC53_00470 [Atta colombica]|uniref:Uncharacterized protein n=1 Tax=Atta colombica TaxID=520822 RepID=A0A195BYB6_9HYME|nr:hypothetical protein ALC53_00470 [Atta colombica]
MIHKHYITARTLILQSNKLVELTLLYSLPDNNLKGEPNFSSERLRYSLNNEFRSFRSSVHTSCFNAASGVNGALKSIISGGCGFHCSQTNSVISSSVSNDVSVAIKFEWSHSQSCKISSRVKEHATSGGGLVSKTLSNVPTNMEPLLCILKACQISVKESSLIVSLISRSPLIEPDQTFASYFYIHFTKRFRVRYILYVA